MFYVQGNGEGWFFHLYGGHWTCSETPLVPEQVLHFFGLKPCKNAFLKGSCSETEVSEQLY